MYRKVDGKWRAELIDWDAYVIVKGFEGTFKDPPEPFEIDPDCNFVPPFMLRYKGVV